MTDQLVTARFVLLARVQPIQYEGQETTTRLVKLRMARVGRLINTESVSSPGIRTGQVIHTIPVEISRHHGKGAATDGQRSDQHKAVTASV